MKYIYSIGLLGLSFLVHGIRFDQPSSVWIWEGFQRNSAYRISSYPYISGDTFRAFCDHVFDETYGAYIETDAIKEGDSIFLTYPYLDYFFTQILPHIAVPVVLVTHNGDESFPGPFSSYLDDSRILAWFSVNIDRDHPKLHPIPIGMANAWWPHGNPDIMNQARAIQQNRDIFLYLNIATTTHPDRLHVYNTFVNQPFVTQASGRPYYDYLIDFGRSLFVVSPRGNGIDCHRTWESLLMGAIPLVPRTSIMTVYDALPVIIVDDWATITYDFLIAELERVHSQTYSYERLFADYWFNLIRSYKKMEQ